MSASNSISNELVDLLSNQGGRIAVKGTSMWPLYPDGCSVQINPVSSDDLQPGDVVLTKLESHFRLHRFVAFVDSEHFYTAGDYERYQDPKVAVTQLIGRIEPEKGFRRLLDRVMKTMTLWRFKIKT